MKYYDVVILGAGPSGMTAALEIKSRAPQFSVLLLEKNKEIGKKLRATGNGRCNITNTKADDYDFVRAYLEGLGLPLKEYDNGLVYPHSESAADVVALFGDRLKERGVEVLASNTVSCVKKTDDKSYKIDYDEKHSVIADCVIFAMGGKAGPAFGTTGDAYGMLRKLGHTVVSAVPVLTSIECNGQGCEKIAGVRARGRVKLLRDGTEVFSESGEIQFTKYGLSGICIFNMTRYMRFSGSKGLSSFEVQIELFNERDFIERRVSLARSESGIGKNEKAKSLLRGVLKESLSEYVIERAGVDLEKAIAELNRDEMSQIDAQLQSLSFYPTAIRGWKEAQCSSGGVSLDEVDADSCESKIHENLYITGELLDYDGPCGGYNLNNAWLTGIKAGRAIASKCVTE